MRGAPPAGQFNIQGTTTGRTSSTKPNAAELAPGQVRRAKDHPTGVVLIEKGYLHPNEWFCRVVNGARNIYVRTTDLGEEIP